jgi:hypothetical protein
MKTRGGYRARKTPLFSSRSIFTLVLAMAGGAALFTGCGRGNHERLPSITANLIEEEKQLFLVLHNNSDTAFVICKRNFYDPIQCLDIRRLPDTIEFPTEELFGGVLSGVVRSIVTLDDFATLDTGQTMRLPVDLRPVKKDVAPGQMVLARVYFKNIDPFFCSRVDVAKYDKSIQNYCKLMHYVPNRTLRYWVGEVRTPYIPLNLSVYVQRHQQTVRKKYAPVVVRRSRTHPLTKKVF